MKFYLYTIFKLIEKLIQAQINVVIYMKIEIQNSLI